jgi:hypothetical protein
VFQANPGAINAMGTNGGATPFLRNPEAVEQATEARLVPAVSPDVTTLLLIAHQEVMAVYVYKI